MVILEEKKTYKVPDVYLKNWVRLVKGEKHRKHQKGWPHSADLLFSKNECALTLYFQKEIIASIKVYKYYENYERVLACYDEKLT